MGSGLILQEDFAYAPDTALRIKTGEYLRVLKYPNWSRIRIGMLVNLERNAYGTYANTVSLWMGLASGGIPASAYSTRNYVGLSLIGAPGGGTMAYGSSGVTQNDFGYSSATAGYVFRKYGTSFTNGAQLTSGTLLYLPFDLSSLPSNISKAALNRRVMFIMDITRPYGGNGNATVNAYHFNYNSAVNLDLRPDHLWQALYNVGTPTINGVTMQVGLTASAVTLGEEFGPLDTFSIVWNRASFGLNIFALGAFTLIDQSDYLGGGASGAWQNWSGFSTGTLTSGGGTESFGPLFNTTPDTGTLNVPQGFGIPVFNGYASPASGTVYGQGRSDPGAVGAGTVAYAASSLGYPNDTMNNYATGTIISGGSSAGTSWASPIYTGGWANPGSRYDLYGTTVGWPFDPFEDYAVGTVTSGVTLNAGTNWVSYGTILGPP